MAPQSGDKKNASREYLATEPLGRLMVRLAIPAIAAQIANILYNMVDRICLGHIEGVGADVLAGLGICMPIISMISAFSMLIAAGAAPLSSIELGRGNDERALRIVANTQTLVLFISLALMALCYLFMEPLLVLFGASSATAPYASEYLSVYLLGTPFVIAWQAMGLFLLAQGNAREMLIATAAGAVLHVALAVIFVFAFGWGAAGAAASSVLSQVVSGILVLYYLHLPSSALRFDLRLVVPDAEITRQSMSVGSGRFFLAFTEGLLLMVVNSTLQRYGGDAYVGAMTVLYSLQSVVLGVEFGYSHGVQPIVSYCYGARRFARARKATLLTVLISLAGSLVFSGLVVLFPLQSAGIFTSDAKLAQLAAGYVPVFFMGVAVFGAQAGMQTVFMGLGKGLCSLATAVVRKVVLFIPLVLVLAQSMGVDGVYLAEPISDIGSVVFCTILFLLVIPKMLRDEKAVPHAE